MAERFDLAIIGGGIVGASVARDAALRGLRVALFERGDLGGGTSSRTSKLIHGGLRYLDTLQFGLVREALDERAVLLRLAPHLVWPCPFLLPFYRGQRKPRWLLETGLFLYERLAGSHSLGRVSRLAAPEVLELEPDLPRDGLLGAGLYLDAQMDDARLCLENALDAAALGASLYAHHEVESVALSPAACTVRARDRLEPEAPPVEVEAMAVVNAAGPWADRVRELAGKPREGALRPSRGSHLVLSPLTRKNALILFSTRDGRVFFVLPDARGSLVGTTEAEEAGNPDDCAPTVPDLAYLVGEIRRRWPGRVQVGEQVHRAFAGLRPLARAAGPLGQVSRESRLLSENGLFTIVGGKYTTYRAIAEQALDRILKKIGKSARPCSTRERPLPGAGAGTREQAAALARARALELRNMSTSDADRLGARYGSLFGGVAVLVEQFPGAHDRAGTRILEGEVVYSLRHEMARRLDDVLFRRLGMWRDRFAARGAAVPVSLWMARHLSWPRSRTQEEVTRVERMLDDEDRVIRASLQA